MVNGKIYIGKHVTDNPNDDYMGSGKWLRRAIGKYGIENFKKEVLFVFDNEDEMNSKEAELVTEEFLSRTDVYNLCPGGQGGFGHLNRIGKGKFFARSKAGALEGRKNADIALEKKYGPNWRNIIATKGFLDKTHSLETKLILSEKNKGEKNPAFGTIRITNGVTNANIKIGEPIPDGWRKGMTKLRK